MKVTKKSSSHIAFAIFGGICSGKSYLKNLLLLQNKSFTVLSKDQAIFNSDKLCREGIKKNWELIHEEIIENLDGRHLIIDETIRYGLLQKVREKGYKIIGVEMLIDQGTRFERLIHRQKKQKQLLNDLSNVVSMKLDTISQNDRRTLWRNNRICRFDNGLIQRRFDQVLNDLYLLGSLFMKDEIPNPLCHNEIDYLFQLEHPYSSKDISFDNICENMIPYKEYKNNKMKKIKYCIWDIGKVVYNYTLEPLHNWCIKNTDDIDYCIEVGYTFNFNPYMLGKVEFFKTLC